MVQLCLEDQDNESSVVSGLILQPIEFQLSSMTAPSLPEMIKAKRVSYACCPPSLLQAKERREGINPDYQDMEDTVTLTSGYKTVAPLADA